MDVALGAEEEPEAERGDDSERHGLVIAVVIPTSDVRKDEERQRLRRTLVEESPSADA